MKNMDLCRLEYEADEKDFARAGGYGYSLSEGNRPDQFKGKVKIIGAEYVFLGEINQRPGQCVVVNCKTGEIRIDLPTASLVPVNP